MRWNPRNSPVLSSQAPCQGLPCARFDGAAILEINAADNFEVVVQVYRLRRILYDEIPCAASEQIEIRSYIIYVFERMAEVLHNLTAHAADTAQGFRSET